MAAKSYYSPFIPAFDSNGLPVAGAQLRFRLTLTTTPTPIYTTAALSIEHANPVVANAAGRFPAIFLDDAVTYRVDILDADGTQIDSIDPYVPGQALKGDPGGNAESIGLFTTAAIGTLAIDSGTTSVRTSGYRTAGRGAARYVYDSSAVGAYVTSNPLSSFLDASGRVFKLDVSSGVVEVDALGAYGDAVATSGIYAGTDDTAAFVAAIALAPREVVVGPRAYMVENATSGAILTLTAKALRGQGRDVSRLCKKPNTTGTQSSAVYTVVIENGARLTDLTIEGNKSGLGLGTNQRNSAIWARGTDTLVERVTCRNHTGYHFWINGQTDPGIRNVFRDCRSINADVHLEPTWSTDALYENIVIEQGDGDVPTQLAAEFYGTTTNLTLRKIKASGTMASSVNIGLGFGAMNGITLDDCNIVHTGTSSTLTVSGGGANLMTGLRISNCTFDASGSTGGLGANLDNVRDAYFSNSFFFGDSIGVAINADCDGVQAANCYAKSNGFQAVEVVSGAANCTWDGRLVGVGSAYTGDLVVSVVTLSTPAGGTVPFRVLATGQGTMASAGGTESRLAITTPTILDDTKVSVMATMREADSLFAPALTGRAFSWSYVSAQSLNLMEKSGTLAGQVVSYTVIEGL